MPNVELKQTVVNTIKENLEGASSIVLVDYRGLTVEEDTKLRKDLREAEVVYKVFKNTMMNNVLYRFKQACILQGIPIKFSEF